MRQQVRLDATVHAAVHATVRESSIGAAYLCRLPIIRYDVTRYILLCSTDRQARLLSFCCGIFV